MSNIFELFKYTSFDTETVNVLSSAYEKACASMHDTGQPYIVSEVIASRIISMAEQGERDPDRLCANALIGLGDAVIEPPVMIQRNATQEKGK